MTQEEVRSRAKSLMEIASTNKSSPDPVPDDIWSELTQLHHWAIQHAGQPTFLNPLKVSPHTWANVEGVAKAILDSLG
jgi:hypothetical protein